MDRTFAFDKLRELARMARQQGDHVTFEYSLLATLRQRELDEVVSKLSATIGLPRVEVTA